MTRLEKIISAVHPCVRVGDIERLNIGDLSHIGDAIEAGEKEFWSHGGKCPINDSLFNSAADSYQRIKSTYTLAGVEVPRPLAEEPEEGDTVWLAAVKLNGEPCAASYFWSPNREWQKQALEVGLVYNNKEDSTALSIALSKLIKNAIKEALADS